MKYNIEGGDIDFFEELKKDTEKINVSHCYITDEPLVEHFITLNEEYFLDEYGLKNNFLILKDFEFKDLDEYTEFRIISVDGRIYPLRRKDFNDLAAFLDDPDLYKNTKKYNL